MIPSAWRRNLRNPPSRTIFNKTGFGKSTSLSNSFFNSFGQIPQTGDPLMWDADSPDGQTVDQTAFGPFRNAEIAAISPDLFDATYYSIDPTYFLNFQQRHLNHQANYNLQPIFGVQSLPISDLGSRSTSPTLKSYDVESQINTALTAGFDPKVLPALYYPLRSWMHLLTSWAPKLAVTYDFPDNRFAQCTNPADPRVPIPGKCWVGGRSGYSVRLVSREDLLIDDWQVGGDGEGAGGILNKPPLTF